MLLIVVRRDRACKARGDPPCKAEKKEGCGGQTGMHHDLTGVTK